jgi:hypothetical protein
MNEAHQNDLFFQLETHIANSSWVQVAPTQAGHDEPSINQSINLLHR